MRTNRIILSFVIVVMVFFAGCASIVSKSEWPVNISSKPDGADIVIKNKDGIAVFSGKTPAIVTLKGGAGYFSGADYTVTFVKDGFETVSAKVERHLNGWYLGGNLVFGGLIGYLIVDPVTGAMWALEDLNIELKSMTVSGKTQEINIVTIDQIPDELRSRMVRVN